MPLFILLFATLLSTSAWSKTTELCGVLVNSQEEIKFSGTEEDWLCGTDTAPAWKNPPNSQKTLYLRSFLQSRGYHQPQFSSDDQGRLIVAAGPRTTLKQLEVVNAPENWDWKKRRNIEGRPFTPGNLTELSKWARRRLMENGYPCPVVTENAIVDQQLFRLNVEPVRPEVFGEVTTVGEHELDTAILDRYSAFTQGASFDVRLLELTSTRVLKDNLYLSTYYDITCHEGDELKIVRRMTPAKPRLLSFGVGVDSEEGPMLRSKYKQARLTEAADSIDLELYGSWLEQSLTAKHRHYFLSDVASRLHIASMASLKRESETSYEALTTTLGAGLALGWEGLSYAGLAQAGPLFTRTDTIRGPEPYRIDALRMTTDIQMTSHDFEYYVNEPQDGWTLHLTTSTQFAGIVSEGNINVLYLQHQILWNLADWDPPWLVLGWRGHMGTYILSKGDEEDTVIPVTQRFFLGGDADMRGFARKQLPSSGEGYLTVLYEGFELRIVEVLPWGLQPLMFLDGAMAGARAGILDAAIYYSPGVGVRWASPLGAVRGTLGRGFVLHPDANSVDPGYQFFFSFGREF